jgi:hypothetical protein
MIMISFHTVKPDDDDDDDDDAVAKEAILLDR